MIFVCLSIGVVDTDQDAGYTAEEQDGISIDHWHRFCIPRYSRYQSRNSGENADDLFRVFQETAINYWVADKILYDLKSREFE